MSETQTLLDELIAELATLITTIDTALATTGDE